VIHEQGTSNINIDSNTAGGGVGFGGGLRGGLGLGKTGSSGTSQTLLAKKNSTSQRYKINSKYRNFHFSFLFIFYGQIKIHFCYYKCLWNSTLYLHF
jgi:hypothetical protein